MVGMSAVSDLVNGGPVASSRQGTDFSSLRSIWLPLYRENRGDERLAVSISSPAV